MQGETLRCTTCGNSSNLRIDAEHKTGFCPACRNTFVVSIAEEFAKVEIDRAKDIENLRELLRDAVNKNDVIHIGEYAGRIKEIIPRDYSAGYYFAYGQSKQNKPKYLENFLAADSENATVKEKNAVLEHLIQNSKIRDETLVENYIRGVGGIDRDAFLDKHNAAFVEKRRLEENYDDIPRDVFVCHRSVDIEVADCAVRALERGGNTCWISTRNLRPNDTENYWKSIEAAIKSCKIFLVISSKDAMPADDVKRELNIAKDADKPRVEYKIDEKPHTPFFKAFFDGRQWIQAFPNPGNHYHELSDRIFRELEDARLAARKKSELEEKLAAIEKEQKAQAAAFAAMQRSAYEEQRAAIEKAKADIEKTKADIEKTKADVLRATVQAKRETAAATGAGVSGLTEKGLELEDKKEREKAEREARERQADAEWQRIDSERIAREKLIEEARLARKNLVRKYTVFYFVMMFVTPVLMLGVCYAATVIGSRIDFESPKLLLFFPLSLITSVFLSYMYNGRVVAESKRLRLIVWLTTLSSLLLCFIVDIAVMETPASIMFYLVGTVVYFITTRNTKKRFTGKPRYGGEIAAYICFHFFNGGISSALHMLDTALMIVLLLFLFNGLTFGAAVGGFFLARLLRDRLVTTIIGYVFIGVMIIVGFAMNGGIAPINDYPQYRQIPDSGAVRTELTVPADTDAALELLKN
ncbi:MAG: TIR domain-containing protein [Clostridiales bacterium]|nr:TIR domain-containing protein [Clostridiales bacterium]